jgi:hypothetical protein
MKPVLKPTNIIAVLILAAGILRIILKEELKDRFDETTLLFFFGAAAVFLLSRIKTLKYKDFEIELNQIKEELKETKLVANIAQDVMKVESAAINNPEDSKSLSEEFKPGNAPNDPWKGVFGGNNFDKNFGRILTASVVELKNIQGWYSVSLSVKSTGANSELTGTVQFFLHDTFPNNRPIVTAINNQAVLNIRAWGAFTVGAVTDNGQCKLELDLAQLDSAPLEFRSR